MVNEKHQQWKEASRLNYKWLIERRVKMKIFQKKEVESKSGRLGLLPRLSLERLSTRCNYQ